MSKLRKYLQSILTLLFVFSLLFPSGGTTPAFALQEDELKIDRNLDTGRGVETKVEEFLNVDGTLKLDDVVSGSLNLSGWDIRLDPQRGPVFNAREERQDVSTQADIAEGHWGSLSDTSAISGGVQAIAISGTDVYVAGEFSNAGGVPEADSVAKWDGVKWSALGGDGAGNGSIKNGAYAIAVNGSDVYVGGDFDSINNHGKLIHHGAVAKWDGKNWSALGNLNIGNYGLNGYIVRTIAVDGVDVYVGGKFDDLYSNGVIIADGVGLIKWDGTHWMTMGGAATPNIVNAIAIDSGNIYVGGGFVNAGNIPEADKIARWDGGHWSALGSNGAGDGAINNVVNAIAISGTDIYVGGSFTDAANIAEADYVAKWDGTNWSALGGDGLGNGPIDSYVKTIVADEMDIYVGGTFSNAGGIPSADYIAKWDGANWSALGSNGAGNGSLSLPSEVYSIAANGEMVYIGGGFWDVNNHGTVLPSVDNFARWDGVNWSGFGNGDGSLQDEVYAVTVIGTNVYVGGCFDDVNNNSRFDHLVKWDGLSWSILWPDWNPPPTYNGCVLALATDGTNLYAGGNFDYDIAKWDGSEWFYLTDANTGLGLPLDTYVRSIAIHGSDVYVGGAFSDAGGIPEADCIAKWDGTYWSALGGDGNGNGPLQPDAYGNGPSVETVAVSGNNVYVGGWFANVRNGLTVLNAADYVAKWDGANWSALGSNGAGNGALNDFVAAIASDGMGTIYVGGLFTNAGGIPQADYIAAWNGTTWSALGNNGAGNGSLQNMEWTGWSVVNAIVADGRNVYVGGKFNNINNQGSVVNAADYIARWDGINWTALSNNGIGGGSLNSIVNTLALSGSNLYVGGLFYDVNDYGTSIYSADNIASYKLRPSVPQLLSPVNGVLIMNNSTPLFRWSYYTPMFDHYQLQIATDNIFASALYDVNLTASEYVIPSPLGINSAYYWRVRAFNKNGVTAGWSPVGMFRIPFGNTEALSPENGIHLLSLRPTLDWSDVAGAGYYKIQISQSSDFAPIVAEETSSTSAITLLEDLPPAQKLFWRVRAEGSNGPCKWTDPRWFTTPNPPSVPLLKSPDDRAAITGNLPVFRWNQVNVPRNTLFDHYQLQVSTNSVFTAPLIDVNLAGFVNPAYAPGSPLASGTIFYWRVRAVNSSNETGSWSAVWSFVTPGNAIGVGRPRISNGDVSLPAPMITSPFASEKVNDLRPMLEWRDVPGATGYIVQASMDQGFGSLLLLSATTVNSEYGFLQNLPANSVIYWRVLTVKGNIFSKWSDIRSFKTP